MTTQCPKCKAENPDDSIYCGKCATPLSSAEDAQSSFTKTLETPVEEIKRGTLFADRYEIIEELGTGGMGKVYRVEDTKAEEEIALKLIKPEIAADKKTIDRFRNELTTARKIRHKNICGMYDLGEDKGSYYITMEYVPGEDLKSFLRRSKKLTVETTVSIGIQICEGLLEAHRLGVVHRDLKPQNIMIDKEGNARIMDFGIARSLRAKGITGSGVMIGTPEYMSPEQVDGKEADQRADIYSLGVILYEMVTGRVPFEGDTPFSIGVKQKSEAPQPPKEINEQIPEDLNHVILKCMEKDKENRFQSVSELQSELMNLEKGIPTTERIVPEQKSLSSREITVQFSLKKLFIPALAVIAIVIIGLILWQVFPNKEAAPVIAEKPSIAVLPFLDLSQQKDQEYFCDGITDEMISKLSRLREWRVMPRTTMMLYKNTNKSIKEIGQELDVKVLLEGSIRKEGDDIRITASLINVPDSSQLWSETYNQKLESIFVIQSEIAQEITKALKAQLSPEEEEKLLEKPTENLAAYDYYLKGQEYYRRYQKQENEYAVELFKKALELDPDFALAYSGLCDAYGQRVGRYGFPSKWLDEAFEAGKKAISLRPDLSEGYKAIGLVHLFRRHIRDCIEANKKAIELNPNNEQAVSNLGWAYANIGEYDKAMPWFKKALTLDPMASFSHAEIGTAYLGLDMLAEAEQWLENGYRLQPNLGEANSGLIRLYLMQDKYDIAINHCQKWLIERPNSAGVLSWTGYTMLFAGDLEKAEQFYQKSVDISQGINNMTHLGYLKWKKGLEKEARELFGKVLDQCLERIEKGNEVSSVRYPIAVINTIQGKNDEAYEWLQKAIDSGLRNYRLVEKDPRLENIHNEEQFKQMMAEVKKKVDEMRMRVEREEK